MAETLTSTEPATGETLWTGAAGDVDAEIAAARAAWPSWAAKPLAVRVETMRRFANIVRAELDPFADLIARETGKPLWEARTEVEAVINKVEISIGAHGERTPQRRLEGALGARVAVRHKPHGVLGVLGPYNFPAHLPNGHIVPALIAGNTVVFKPSEKTPAVGEFLTRLYHETGVPEGVVRVVQGGVETGKALAAHPALDGLLFTGSARAGLALHRQFAETPQKILALEMGGNNPIVVWDAKDLHAAASVVVQSAYLSAGQRCTAARRLIVEDGQHEELIEIIAGLADRLIVDHPHADPAPFMGPVIDNAAADQLQEAFLELMGKGGKAIRRLDRKTDDKPFLTPALIDVTAVERRPDAELFGPVLQIVRVKDFDSAIAEANATRYGLSASLIGGGPELYDRFWAGVRAGVINWNGPTNGAPSKAPFGGVGLSGNHRPSAYYAADYCAYPVTSSEVDQVRATIGVGLADAPGARKRGKKAATAPAPEDIVNPAMEANEPDAEAEEVAEAERVASEAARAADVAAAEETARALEEQAAEQAKLAEEEAAAEETRKAAEEEARRAAEEEERRAAEAAAAEEEAKRLAEEEARLAAEAAAAEEEAKRVAEEEARRLAEEEEAKRVAEEEARRLAEEEEARRAAEEEAQRIAEEEAKRAAEEEARRLAEEEAKRAAEEEARRLAEEEAKRAAEAEARRLAEEEAKRAAEEEIRRLAEEEAKRAAEAEARRLAEEEAKRAAEEEARRLAEEEAKRAAEEEARRLAEEEAKRVAEEEARRLAEEEAKRVAEEEALRLAEEEAKRAAEEAAAEEARRAAEEAAAEEARRAAEEAAAEEARQAAEAAADEEARHAAEVAAAEEARRAAEEAAAEEAKRAAEAAAAEEAERAAEAAAAEEAKRAAEAAAAEEAKRAAEAAAAEEAKRAAEAAAAEEAKRAAEATAAEEAKRAAEAAAAEEAKQAAAAEQARPVEATGQAKAAPAPAPATSSPARGPVIPMVDGRAARLEDEAEMKSDKPPKS